MKTHKKKKTIKKNQNKPIESINFKNTKKIMKENLDNLISKRERDYAEPWFNLCKKLLKDLKKANSEKELLSMKINHISKNLKDTLDYIEIPKKNIIEKIPVLISREKYIKGFTKFVIPPVPFTSYIECNNNFEEIVNMISNHFYFVKDENKEKRYTINTEQMNWIAHTQASFYEFINACKHLKIFAKVEYPNKLYCNHFSKRDMNGVNVFIKQIAQQISKYNIIKKDNYEEEIKDEVVKEVIRAFLE